MKKLLLAILLLPAFISAQQSPSDTLLLKSPNGTVYGLYITNSGVLEIVNFASTPGSGQSPTTGTPSVGHGYSDLLTQAATQNISAPSSALQALQQRYFQKLDSIGFLANCDYFYVFANDGSEEFGLLNWANPSTFLAKTKKKPEFNAILGFSPGSKKGYIQTDFTPSQDAVKYTANDACLGAYVTGLKDENSMVMGSNGSFDSSIKLKHNNIASYRINNSISTTLNAPADTSGLFVLNRESQKLDFFWRGTIINSVVSFAPYGLPNSELYILARNLNNSAANHISYHVSIAFAGGSIKNLVPAVTQFTEDYLAAVEILNGIPQPTLSARATALSKEDILSINDLIRGHESKWVDGEFVVSDLYSMLDTSDVAWGPNGELAGVKATDPVYSWDVRYEFMKYGFKNPVDGIVEWTHPTAIDSIALWTGSNLKDTTSWFRFFASNDMINWYPLTGKINYSFYRHFRVIPSMNDKKYRYFKAERQFAHNPMKIIPFGRQDEFIPYKKYIPIDSLHIRKNTFAQAMGVNAYTTDSLDQVTQFANVSQFNNFNRYMARPGDPWGAMINYFNSYTTIFHSGVKHKGPDGQPIKMLRGGLEDVYEYWRDHGVDFVLERFQLSSNAWLKDSLNGYYQRWYGQDTAILTSSTVYITDNKFSFPRYSQSEPQVWADTITLQRNLDPYDYSKDIYEAYDTTYPADGNNPAYLSGRYIEFDENRNPTGRISSMNNFMRIPPEAIIAMADPAKRFEVLTTPETYELWGDFIFNYTAVTGRNKNIPPNDIYVIKGDSTLIGLDLVDAQAGENEADRDWQGGLAQMPPYAIGMMLSVQYDGHLGLVGGIRDNHAVGMHTADSTMKMVLHSTINPYMHRSIAALKWAEYFRARDMHLTAGYHPYNGEKLTVKFKNVAFDFHEYRSTAGGQGSGTFSAGSDFALTPELSHTTTQMLLGLQVIRTLWPDYEVYCSEYGYGHITGGKFSASRELIGIYDSATGTYQMDPDYDLTYAQASNNDWDSMFRHGYLEKIFIYRLRDGDSYWANIDNTTTPYSIDRQAIWDQNPLQSPFLSHGLYTHARGVSVPKPAAYSMKTLLDVVGNSYQIDYIRDEQDSVAMFKYYDFANRYWTYAVRRYTNHNGKTFNYTIDIPTEVKKVTRIEPVRNEPALTTIPLGDIETYTTTVTEKYFLLKMEI